MLIVEDPLNPPPGATFQDFQVLKFTDSALDPIINEIDRLFGFKFYYAALALSLSLPDICSSLELSAAKKNSPIGPRYKRWCEIYLQPKFSTFDPVDCWALRGSVLHNGKLHGNREAKYDRIIFTLPSPALIHELVCQGNGGSDETALQLDIKTFLHQMVAAVQEWFSKKKNSAEVSVNLKGLVRYRTDGLAPHCVGIPVIA
ncbi:hypothetical protein [Novosphingopyxis sp. YJ-S2-01]|uniref:hypothetical protein n=1 Tax=Novosphingopyxis sp. YJ-S2-01 TaxID=2794021 RepID=UPI0018DC7365|nr:hypothetical protein [Novosphingopyxis sp. YJ-S2-01]MBH9537915.1 hypothetical protein [Novosphingopyxis sp. YJ-S2-01]